MPHEHSILPRLCPRRGPEKRSTSAGLVGGMSGRAPSARGGVGAAPLLHVHAARFILVPVEVPAVSHEGSEDPDRPAPWVLPVCVQLGSQPQEHGVSRRGYQLVQIRPHEPASGAQSGVAVAEGSGVDVPGLQDDPRPGPERRDQYQTIPTCRRGMRRRACGLAPGEEGDETGSPLAQAGVVHEILNSIDDIKIIDVLV
jgi:hypothetical protein